MTGARVGDVNVRVWGGSFGLGSGNGGLALVRKHFKHAAYTCTTVTKIGPKMCRSGCATILFKAKQGYNKVRSKAKPQR